MKPIKISVITSRCLTDGANGQPVFGIFLLFENGKTVICPDLGDDRHRVVRLCHILKKADPEMENMKGVFEDFVQAPAPNGRERTFLSQAPSSPSGAKYPVSTASPVKVSGRETPESAAAESPFRD